MTANHEATSKPRIRTSGGEDRPPGTGDSPGTTPDPSPGADGPSGGATTAGDDGDTGRVDELLGGLDAETTADVAVPDRLVDQVIGQDEARDVILRAAQQRRNVLMIGSPGTGKSMLSKAMAELLPAEELQDVVIYPNADDANEPVVRTVPAGKGDQIVSAYREEARKNNRSRAMISWLLIGLVVVFGLLFVGDLLLTLIAVAILWFILRPGRNPRAKHVPKLLVDNADRTTSPFVDATGAHAGALLGDVRHDPYQSGGMETPAHDRVEAGAIHKASRGVLYVDEVNTLDLRSQQHLLTAMQDREFGITGQSEQSSGALVHTDPVPTDFVLVAAGNLDAVENMHPALRSRIKGNGYEVYMDDTIEDTPEHRRDFARFVAQEVRKDGRLPEFTRGAIAEIVLEARRRAGRKNRLTLEFRDLGGLVRVAGDIARDEGAELVTRDHVVRAKGRARSIEQQIADEMIDRSREYDLTVESGSLVGRVNGLAVVGKDSGIVLPVVAEVTPAMGEGRVIATGKLQDIAEEAVQNVSAIVKRFSEEDLSARDIHIQFVGSGGGGVDGDSASITVATAVISALENVAVDQSVAMTGSLSVRGDVLPVGGVTHKVEAAVKAGIETVIVPAANLEDVMLEEEYLDRVRVVPVSHIGEVLEVAIVSSPVRATLVERIKNLTGSNVGPVSRRGPGDCGSPTAG